MDYKFLYETNEIVGKVLGEKKLEDIHDILKEIIRGLDSFRSYIQSFTIQDDAIQKKLLYGIEAIEKASEEVLKKIKSQFSKKDQAALATLVKWYEQTGIVFKQFKKNHIKRLDKNTMLILNHLNSYMRQLNDFAELGLYEGKLKISELTVDDLDLMLPDDLKQIEKDINKMPFIGPEEMVLLKHIRILQSGGFDATAGKWKKSKRVTPFSKERI